MIISPVMKKKVLIADDFTSMRRIVRAALRPLPGLEIHEAGDGQLAWEKLNASPHDLLISDVSMPRLDGWELVQRVRHGAAQPGLPIILVSAEPRPACLPGNLHYLGKPFDPRILREMVGELLNSQVSTD